MSEKKNCRHHYIKPIIDIIIPIVLVAGGIFLILFFTPLWVWAILLGIGLIYIGIYIVKRWR